MHSVVKILSADDGEPTPGHLLVWHLVVKDSGSDCTLCGGEFFGFGESACEFETKTVTRGGITCQNCLKRIKELKAIKL